MVLEQIQNRPSGEEQTRMSALLKRVCSTDSARPQPRDPGLNYVTETEN